MNTQNIHSIFSPMIRAAIEKNGAQNAAGHRSVNLGNVEFWLEGEDLAYSLPTSQWDVRSVSNDLSKAISPSAADPREQLVEAEADTDLADKNTSKPEM